jgi:NADH-quinone oxidoreductase subunit D
MLLELNRVISHLFFLATHALDVGAMSIFLYAFREREFAMDLMEAYCGARLTHSAIRIGGVPLDLPEGWLDKLKAALKEVPEALKDVDRLLTRNKIFMDRTIDVGVISREDAISYSYTGPCLRACGVEHDIRKAHPYLVYDELEFDVPVDDGCDVYARYIVRMEEMWESLRILEQCVEKIPDGPVNISDRMVVLPKKEKVYTEMEAMIRQFKLITEGIKPPVGSVYSCTESPNGELGFYIVSDGSGNPYRVRVRPPCFPIFSAVDEMIEGSMIADLIAAVSSLNIIAGELER